MAEDRPTPTRKGFGPYARCLADRMELRDWTVCVSDAPPANPNHEASAEAAYGQKFVTIALSERYLHLPEAEQRATMCHKLIHAHWGPVDHLIRRLLPEREYEAYQLSMEYAVEGLAQAIAPSMPLPSEVAAPKPPKRAKR